MASHVWESSTYTPSTLRLAACAFCYALHNEASVELATKFAAYMAERKRQASHVSVKWMWYSAAKSGFRFSKGMNSENYRAAGERLLLSFPTRVDLDEGAPLEAAVDKLREDRSFFALYEELR